MGKFLWSWVLFTWGGLHRYFGNANSMLSEHERALHYFERAYEVDPTFVAARLHKGILLTREFGRHDEALAIFDAILADTPKDAKALFNRGLALQENGRFQDALTTFEAYLSLPQRDEYWDEANRLAQTLRSIIEEIDAPADE